MFGRTKSKHKVSNYSYNPAAGYKKTQDIFELQCLDKLPLMNISIPKYRDK